MEDCNTESIAEEYQGDAEMVDLLQRVERARKSYVKSDLKKKNLREKMLKQNMQRSIESIFLID